MDPVHLHTKSDSSKHVERVESQDVGAIPDDYYRSKLFIGTVTAVAISLVCVSRALGARKL
jgi:hypothetical protein